MGSVFSFPRLVAPHSDGITRAKRVIAPRENQGRRERRRLPRDRETSLSSLTQASVPFTLPENTCRFQKR